MASVNDLRPIFMYSSLEGWAHQVPMGKVLYWQLPDRCTVHRPPVFVLIMGYVCHFAITLSGAWHATQGFTTGLDYNAVWNSNFCRSTGLFSAPLRCVSEGICLKIKAYMWLSQASVLLAILGVIGRTTSMCSTVKLSGARAVWNRPSSGIHMCWVQHSRVYTKAHFRENRFDCVYLG